MAVRQYPSVVANSAVALVTGANKGLGREAARQLAQHGMTVLLGNRDPDRGVLAASDLSAEGLDVQPVRLDVTDVASVEKIADHLRREYGRLDVLVNNAGTIVETEAVATTAPQMRQTFEVNVFGVVTTIHILLPLLHAPPRRASSTCPAPPRR